MAVRLFQRCLPFSSQSLLECGGTHAFSKKRPFVISVLGGPGSGKSTLSGNIMDRFGFAHMNMGALLRGEVASGSKDSAVVQSFIAEGRLVPCDVTVKILLRGMKESRNYKFVLDGFPRTKHNRVLFRAFTGLEPDFVILLECPLNVMEERLLLRNEGRADDTHETIRRRVRGFMNSKSSVLDYFESSGKLRKIDASGSIQEVFEKAQKFISPFLQ